MATWTFTPLASDAQYQISAKLGTNTVANSGHLTDADVGKPVKLLAAGRYGLCADGDDIDGFLVGVNPETVDGYAFGTVQTGGRIYAVLSGASTFGYIVEAGDPATARTAETNNLGKVSSHRAYAGVGGTAMDTTAELLPVVFARKWRIISGAVTDGATVLLEAV